LGGEFTDLNFGSRPSEDLSENITIWERKNHPEDKLGVNRKPSKIFNRESGANWICEYDFKKADEKLF